MQLRRRHQRGVTLLESLIAIVLVALGVLGILGVQLRTLADTQTAVRRAQAIRLIEDLSERIRANPSALVDGVLARYVVDWDADDSSDETPPKNCSTDACDPGDLARADVLQWKATVASTLPLGNANVFTVAAGSGGNIRTMLGVMVSWRENERQREGDSEADTKAYKKPFVIAPVGTGAGDKPVSCEVNRICHLQYLQPTLRCLPSPGSNSGNPVVTCP